MSSETASKHLLQLEISRDKLALLFESGLICAAEIRCLTAYSKQQVSDLCLSSCAKRIACNISLLNERPRAQSMSETQSINVKNQIKKLG